MNDVLLDTQYPLTRSIPQSPSHDSFSSASRPSKLPSKGGKKRRITSDIIVDELMEVTSSMKEIARAIAATNQRIYTASEITMELKKLGLEKWELMDALDFLKDNEHLVERFFCM